MLNDEIKIFFKKKKPQKSTYQNRNLGHETNITS